MGQLRAHPVEGERAVRLTRAQRRQRGAKNRAAAKQRRDGTYRHFCRSVDQLVHDCETFHRRMERKFPAAPAVPGGRMGLGTVVATLGALVEGDDNLKRAMGIEGGVEGVIDKIASGDFPPKLELPCSPEDEREG